MEKKKKFGKERADAYRPWKSYDLPYLMAVMINDYPARTAMAEKRKKKENIRNTRGRRTAVPEAASAWELWKRRSQGRSASKRISAKTELTYRYEEQINGSAIQ